MDLTLEIIEEEPSKITIVAPDESTFSLEFDDDDSAGDIRDKIAEKLGIPSNELRLSIDEDELSKDFIPSDGDTITVEPPTVVVLLPDGEILELAAADTTIGDIKEVLEEETGVAIREQNLFVNGSDEPLDDGIPITRDIKLQMKIKQVTKEPISITVKTADEESIDVEVEEDDSFATIRQKVAKVTGLATKDVRLSKDEEELDTDYVPSKGDILHLISPTVTVELPSSEMIELEALPGTTIGDIKEALEEETGIPKARQCMFLQDQLLDDDKEITTDMSVKLEEMKSVTIKNYDGSEFDFEVQPRCDFATFKPMVSTKINIPAKNLRLAKDNVDLDKTYQPSNGDILTVLPPRVFVQFPDGSRKEFPVLPTQSISDLKKSIEKKTRMPSISQQVYFFQKEEELQDDVLFSRSDFVDGTVLQVRYEKPEVTVMMPDGTKMELELEFSDTKNDVRYKIAREIGARAQDVCLLKDGVELDKRYKPKQGDVLTVQAQSIIVKMPDGTKVSVSVMPTQTIADVKDTIEQITGTPMDPLRLVLAGQDKELDENSPISEYNIVDTDILQVRSPDGSSEIKVNLPEGRSFNLVIDPDKSIEELKAAIEEQSGLPVGAMKLNGEVLDCSDGAAIKDNGAILRDGNVLDVDPPEIDVTLPDGRTVKVKVLPSMTVIDLKYAVKEQTPELNLTEHTLVPTTGTDALDDLSSVRNLDLTEGVKFEPVNSAISEEEDDYEEVEKEFEVSIQHWNGDIFSVDARPSESVTDMNERIASLTQIPPDQQRLTFEGNLVKKDRTLKEQNIKDGSMLLLEKMQLSVELTSGERVDLAVEPEFSIQKVKEILHTETSIDPIDQYLSHDGEDISGDETVADFELGDGDVLKLEPFTVSVLCWSGDVVDMKGIGSNSTIDEMMDIIFNHKSVPKEKQKLMRGGQVVSGINDKTLKDCGIQHKDVLMLDNPEKVDLTATPTKSKNPFSFLQKATNLLSSPKVHKPTEEKEVPMGDENSKKLAEEKPDVEQNDLEPENDVEDDAEIEIDIQDDSSSSSEDEESSSKEGDDDDDDSVNITIITPELKPLKVHLDPNDTMKDVKRKIAKDIGLPPDELRLSRHSDEALVPEDFTPKAGDIYTVEPPTVIITSPTGQTFELSVVSDTTIDDVKDYLVEQTGVPKEEQKLFMLDGDGIELNDDVHIKTDTNLKLNVKEEDRTQAEVKVSVEEAEEADNVSVQDEPEPKVEFPAVQNESHPDETNLIEKEVHRGRGATGRRR